MMRRAQPWLGTLVEITADAAPEAFTRAFDQIALVQGLMSFHAPASDVSRLNRADVGSVLTLDPHSWRVLQLADVVMRASDGLFNVACAPQLVAWGLLPAPAECPPAYLPGQPVYQLAPDGSVHKIAPGWIDLGGIAKGYAVDLAIAALQADGVTSACVNAGGDLRVIGPRDWPVQVRAPQAPGRSGAQLALRDGALATSASYFSRSAWRGATVSALVDGASGRALVQPTSVSVRAPSCALADALTKVVLASGDAQHPALAPLQASAFII